MSAFGARHATRSATIHLDAPPDEVFPLFGPVREAEWAEGWRITVRHSTSDLLEEAGAVFTTQFHDEATIWLVTQYEPAQHRIEYARITPGSRAARVLIACEGAADGRTAARITHEITALAEAGNAFIEHFSEGNYAHMMGKWERAINQRLRGGATRAPDR